VRNPKWNGQAGQPWRASITFTRPGSLPLISVYPTTDVGLQLEGAWLYILKYIGPLLDRPNTMAHSGMESERDESVLEFAGLPKLTGSNQDMGKHENAVLVFSRV
jgi:hypothetical protein